MASTDFSTVSVDSFAASRSVIELPNTATVGQALSLLSEHGISSVPVWNTETSQYDGWVDSRDITALLVRIMSQDSDDTRFMNLRAVNSRAITIDETPITEVIATGDEFVNLPEGSFFQEVLDVLGRRAHRAGIYNRASGKMTKVISQFDVVRFLAELVEQSASESFSALWQTTIQDANIAFKTVTSVRGSSNPLDAFSVLASSNLSGVPVVNSSGVIVSVLSTTDVRHVWTANKFEFMDVTLSGVLHRAAGDGGPREPVVVSPTATIAEALFKLRDEHVHRVFVIDADRKPVGVISLKDIISSILLPRE